MDNQHTDTCRAPSCERPATRSQSRATRDVGVTDAAENVMAVVPKWTTTVKLCELHDVDDVPETAIRGARPAVEAWWVGLTDAERARVRKCRDGYLPEDVMTSILNAGVPVVSEAWFTSVQSGPSGFPMPSVVRSSLPV